MIKGVHWDLEHWYVTIRPKYQPSGARGTRSPPARPYRLQRHTSCKIKNGRQWAPKWPTGSGKLSTPRFLGILSNFR